MGVDTEINAKPAQAEAGVGAGAELGNMKDAMCKMMQCVRCRSLEGGYPSSVEVIKDNEDFVCFLGFYSLF